ncbi:hypothetical protein Pint_36372 [Pistacia integerrima]|uniref:Uncharacterized protein n=1 Tax=Pistacia integerrima TaxID=434235 RepID=A0ACC0XZ98_9ROSI|nr:hypothetical protein Pint_36372 [Pistacia integerrima]
MAILQTLLVERITGTSLVRFVARNDTLLSVVGIDTSASTHMTSNEGNLHNLRPYTGNDHVMLGNREFLKVTHTGDALLGFGQSAIILRNVLLVPKLGKSLLSIG